MGAVSVMLPPPNRRLCVLGATGSIGTATLAVARRHPDWYTVDTLAAASSANKMARLCREWHPARAVLADEEQAEKLHSELAGEGIAVEAGAAALDAAAADAASDTVVAAISGAGGVDSTLAAVGSGKRVLLANKEALVMAGEIVMQRARAAAAELLPIDSEHCSLFELLRGRTDFYRLWLTASGGAVRDLPLDALPAVAPETALTHPNWSMGPKITVDSATMMNKVLEIIEAAVLFHTDAASIGVVMHPQSLYHAFVEFADGSLTASISQPNMEIPIAQMLRYPHAPAQGGEAPAAGRAPDWAALSAASFSPPDARRYPCLRLAAEALARGGCAPAVLSAANEVAVRRFLSADTSEQIAFTDIARLCAAVLAAVPDAAANSMDDIWAADAEARRHAHRWCT